MTGSEQFARSVFCTGALASVATTWTAAACGEAEEGSPIAPLNAVSHIVWGDEAATHDEASLKYTLTGLALNAAAVTSWAAVHELLFGRAADKGNVVGAMAGGAVVSALAYVTDYAIVPERLTPGFEKRLSNRSLFGVYATLALALGVGSLLSNRQAARAGS